MERWYWIELIGFDNEKEDFGVGAFLSRNVSTTGVSILFSHIDILFHKEDRLPERACSYFGHEYNRERRRQDWTRAQLRGLVRELKSRGIKVFFSCFDMTSDITDQSRLCFNSNGNPEKLLYVIKPLDESLRVGDKVIEAIAEFIDEFGFDGLQLADGLSSNRLSIENGDFSLPLCKDSPIAIPKRLMKDGADVYVKRREWILKNARYEWTCYLADLWAELYKKLFDRIKKPIIFNNAWTRDSFEAFYRYGLDYSLCELDKAYGIMIEENSATRAITNVRDEGGVEFPLSHRNSFTYEYALMQQNIRLVTDGLKQISLTPISDTMEQWDAIRHCPTELSRAIVRRYNNFVYRKGKFEVCCDAPHYCLSDGVPRSDWEWLAKQESYRIPTPDLIDGFAAVCNPSCLHADVKQFCEKRDYFGSALLNELVYGGLNLGASVSLSEVEGFNGARALLVTDLNAYSEEDKAMLAKSSLPILVVGTEIELSLECSAKYSGKYLSVALYGTHISPKLDSLSEKEKIKRAKKCSHGEIWTEPLSYRRVDEGFFAELCRIMNEAFGLDRCGNSELKITSFISQGEKYILISSDSYTYELPTVITKDEIKSATALMKDMGYKVRISEAGFTVRIPPRSLEIIKLEA